MRFVSSHARALAARSLAARSRLALGADGVHTGAFTLSYARNRRHREHATVSDARSAKTLERRRRPFNSIDWTRAVRDDGDDGGNGGDGGGDGMRALANRRSHITTTGESPRASSAQTCRRALASIAALARHSRRRCERRWHAATSRVQAAARTSEFALQSESRFC